MKGKSKLSLGRMLKDIIFMVPSLFFSVSHLTATISAEAQLAIRSLVVIVVLCFMTATLLTAAWLCLLGMLLTWMISIQLSLIVSFLILFVCNIILLGLILFLINRYRRDLEFSETKHIVGRFLP